MGKIHKIVMITYITIISTIVAGLFSGMLILGLVESFNGKLSPIHWVIVAIVFIVIFILIFLIIWKEQFPTKKEEIKEEIKEETKINQEDYDECWEKFYNYWKNQ